MPRNKEDKVNRPYGLNKEQFELVTLIYNKGMSRSEAYIQVYRPKMKLSKKEAGARAYSVLQSKKVKEYIEHLNTETENAIETEKSTILSIQERMEFLTRVIRAEEKDTKPVASHIAQFPPDLKIRLEAVKILNEFDVKKPEANAGISDVIINVVQQAEKLERKVSKKKDSDDKLADTPDSPTPDLDDVMGDE